MKARVALATAVLIASVVALWASPVFSAATQAPRITFNSVATVTGGGSGLRISGTIQCQAHRFFSVFLEALQPARSLKAIGWGDVPAAGASVASRTCNGATHAWHAVLGQGTKESGIFGSAAVRVCAIFRTFGAQGRPTLGSACKTIRAR